VPGLVDSAVRVVVLYGNFFPVYFVAAAVMLVEGSNAWTKKLAKANFGVDCACVQEPSHWSLVLLLIWPARSAACL
jgi:hypothetical protein